MVYATNIKPKAQKYIYIYLPMSPYIPICLPTPPHIFLYLFVTLVYLPTSIYKMGIKRYRETYGDIGRYGGA
jgi:hypothetical protein